MSSLFLSIPLPIVRTQRTLNSRCFPYSPRSRQRWPAERTTCVHALCIISTMVAHQHVRWLGWERRSGRPSLLTQRDPVKHMRQRKPWNQAFSSTAVKEYEGIVANRIRQLSGCLENLVHESDRKESSSVDIAAWLRYFR